MSFGCRCRIHYIIWDQIEVSMYQQLALLDLFRCMQSPFEEMHLVGVDGH